MLIAPTVPARARELGSGMVEFCRVGDRTVVTSSRASSPLRLLTPTNHGKAAWVFATSFGGGIVAGDHLDIDVHVKAGASAFVGTQSSTKVYRCPADLPCRQTLRAELEDESFFALIPDPVICFTDAAYEQRQQFSLARTANLVVLDWLISGRYARGERWAFSRYYSRNTIHRDGVPLLIDPIRLTSGDDLLTAPHRLHTCEVLGTLVILGPRLAGAAQRLASNLGAQPLARRASLQVSCSPLAEGVIVRFAAIETVLATAFVHEAISFLKDELGECPWLRKC